MPETIHAALARARHYVHAIETQGAEHQPNTRLRQIALLLPYLVQHIDAQAKLLGHPRNRRGGEFGTRPQMSPMQTPHDYDPDG